MMESAMLSTEVLDVPVTCFCSYDHAAASIVQRIRQGDKTFCVAINPEKICFARKDPAFAALLRRAHFHICDGIGAAVAVRWIVGWRIPRITGVGLFLKLLDTACEQGLRVFLLGAKPETNKKACEMLLAQYPRLAIVGQHHGFFTDNEPVLEQINASDADMLFAALGSPRQERWLGAHLDQIDVPFCMGVGGSFDVLTGQVKRAPELFQRTGTEFLYRLIRQPSRWRRQSVLLGFAATVLGKALRTRGPKALIRSRHIQEIYTQVQREAPVLTSTV